MWGTAIMERVRRDDGAVSGWRVVLESGRGASLFGTELWRVGMALSLCVEIYRIVSLL
jgi:hypothetical protein